MAKRTRGTGRPGQRRPMRRGSRASSGPSSRPAAAQPPQTTAVPANGLTPEDEARASELEARIVADERAADTRPRERHGRDLERSAPRPANRHPRGASMAVRYADEYAYVARDLRRIGVVSALLLGILAVLFIVVQVTGTTL
jgi:hypothetical protein